MAIQRRALEEVWLAFLRNYPRPLISTVVTIVEPPCLVYCDETLGEYPNNIVASKVLGDKPTFAIRKHDSPPTSPVVG